MDEELSKVLTELANRALDGVDGMTAFSAEHLPDVLVQLLWWHGVKSGLVFFVGVFAVLVLVCLTLKAARYIKGKDLMDYPEVVLPVGLGWMFALLSDFFGTARNLDWLQILIAPKLYILEYAAGLVG